MLGERLDPLRAARQPLRGPAAPEGLGLRRAEARRRGRVRRMDQRRDDAPPLLQGPARRQAGRGGGPGGAGRLDIDASAARGVVSEAVRGAPFDQCESELRAMRSAALGEPPTTSDLGRSSAATCSPGSGCTRRSPRSTMSGSAAWTLTQPGAATEPSTASASQPSSRAGRAPGRAKRGHGAFQPRAPSRGRQGHSGGRRGGHRCGRRYRGRPLRGDGAEGSRPSSGRRPPSSQATPEEQRSKRLLSAVGACHLGAAIALSAINAASLAGQFRRPPARRLLRRRY